MEPINTSYLESVRKLFQYYKSLGDKAIERMNDEDIHRRPDEESNSIAIIVQHIAGNALSRWTDFLTSDGEKEWRNRDAEFEDGVMDKQALVAFWNKGWDCLFAALDSLQPDDLLRVIYIRNEGHTVVEAINRQLAHYPYHVGQIVFLAKAIAGDRWESLSIPKGKSELVNKDKFAAPRADRFFTDGLKSVTPSAGS